MQITRLHLQLLYNYFNFFVTLQQSVKLQQTQHSSAGAAVHSFQHATCHTRFIYFAIIAYLFSIVSRFDEMQFFWIIIFRRNNKYRLCQQCLYCKI